MKNQDLLLKLVSMLIEESPETPKNETSSGLYSDLPGKYVIVRSRNEGINAGTVVKADETGIILSDSRRIWYHKPSDSGMAWYEGVAVSGLSSDSKISIPVDQKLIAEDYSVTFCSDKGAQSIKGHKSHGQS